jgi:hypothetical protein
MNNMVDTAISYIDSLSIDELEDVFNSHGIKTIRKTEYVDFNFDLEQMKLAVDSPSIEIPKEALETFETFDNWLNEGSMNNIISKLAEQAGYIPNETTNEAFNEFSIDRFAKLIIEATCDVVKDEVQYELNYDKAEYLVKIVKQHFGVE